MNAVSFFHTSTTKPYSGILTTTRMRNLVIGLLFLTVLSPIFLYTDMLSASFTPYSSKQEDVNAFTLPSDTRHLNVLPQEESSTVIKEPIGIVYTDHTNPSSNTILTEKDLQLPDAREHKYARVLSATDEKGHSQTDNIIKQVIQTTNQEEEEESQKDNGSDRESHQKTTQDQDGLRSTLEASIIPAFEMSCKAMFDQVDATFHNGLSKHINDSQQQFNSMHSPVAIALRDAINSASSLTQTLSGELADGQRQLLAMVAAGANSKVGDPSRKLGNGPLPGVHEMPEAPLDPTKELSRLIAEQKYEEAFTLALHRSDVSIVSWLCSQVDLQGILSISPLPLCQGVLLALLQQLACDISNETSRKLAWMTDVAAAINPTDPMIAMHVGPIFDQVYQIVVHQRSLPSTSASEASVIRVLLVVINSVLRSCK